jgi:hypothetical protein
VNQEDQYKIARTGMHHIIRNDIRTRFVTVDASRNEYRNFHLK